MFRRLCAKALWRAHSKRHSSIRISEEVREALASGRQGVVALETTVVTHGLPKPNNYEVARDMMRIVRSNGCVPALIGIQKGQIHVGMTEQQLQQLADDSSSKMKVAKRDIGYCVSQKLDGGTTVSATAYIAASAGISVFSTGGIGGVHRNAERTFDISSDLVEMGKLPICVVCAGCKSILDIAKTLEFLETHSVQVSTLGGDRTFPAFFLPKSDCHAPTTVRDELEAAQLCHATFDLLKQRSGILVAVPVPLSKKDNTEALAKLIEQQLSVALRELESESKSGKDVTPFLLSRLAQLTHNATVTLNLALLRHNALVGSKIAAALQKLRGSADESQSEAAETGYNSRWLQAGKIRESLAQSVKTVKAEADSGAPKLMVVGGALHETTIRVRDGLQIRDTVENRLPSKSLPGNISTSSGGVGRNVADCAAKLGTKCTLLTALSDCERGTAVLRSTAANTISASAAHHAAASYVSVIDGGGNLLFGVHDTAICELISPQFVDQQEYLFDYGDVAMLCHDANIPVTTMDRLGAICQERKIPLWFEPTSVHKAPKWRETNLFQSRDTQPPLTYISPTYDELAALCGKTVNGNGSLDRQIVIKNSLSFSEALFDRVPAMIMFVKLGPLGVIVIGRDNKVFNGAVYYSSFKQETLPTQIVNVTGAGDSFVAGVISSLLQKHPMQHSVHVGLKCAWHSLQVASAVPAIDPSAISTEKVHAWKTVAQIEEIRLND